MLLRPLSPVLVEGAKVMVSILESRPLTSTLVTDTSFVVGEVNFLSERTDSEADMQPDEDEVDCPLACRFYIPL